MRSFVYKSLIFIAIIVLSSNIPSSKTQDEPGDDSKGDDSSDEQPADEYGSMEESEYSDVDDEIIGNMPEPEILKKQNEVYNESLTRLHHFLETLEGPHSVEYDRNLNDIRTRGPRYTSCKNATLANRHEEGAYAMHMKETTLRPFWTKCLYSGPDHRNPWMIIQNRHDGSLNFDRDWWDYKLGFGDIYGDFWIGLERLHLLTTARSYELQIMISENTGVSHYMEFSKFHIASEKEDYRLTVGGCDTKLCAFFLNHNGMKFSTVDVYAHFERDKRNCAQLCRAGWWYNKCDVCNLNSPFGKPLKRPLNGINWGTGNIKQAAIVRVHMGIREIDSKEHPFQSADLALKERSGGMVFPVRQRIHY